MATGRKAMDAPKIATFDTWAARRRATQYKLNRALARIESKERDTANNAPLTRLPTKGQLTNARKSFRALAKASQRSSMVNMPAPAGHQPVPRFVGEKERAMFAAHQRRQDAGWLHG